MKKVLIAIVAIIVIALIGTMMLPSTVHVERSLEINASPGVVFSQVNDLKKWEAWSPWFKIDPNMKTTYGNETEGVGAKYEWSSEHQDVGNGSLEIVESNAPNAIKTELRFKEWGDENVSKGTWAFEATEKGTKVTWGMDADLEDPVGKIFGLMMDGMVGPMFEKGLASIKEISEAQAEKAQIEVTEAMIEADIWVVSVKSTVDQEGLKTIHKDSYGKIMGFLQENSIEAAGAPLAIFYSWSPETVELACGIPVSDSTLAVTEGLSLTKIPATKALMTLHHGAYENLQATHQLMGEWMKTNSIAPSGACWEVYTTDPTTETDVTKWVTEVYYPVNS